MLDKKKLITYLIVFNILIYSYILGYTNGGDEGVEQGFYAGMDFCREHQDKCQPLKMYNFSDGFIKVEELNINP